jgi:hypothetical protein
VGKSKKIPGQRALFLTRKVKKGDPFAVYPGWAYVLGDPSIPEDNTYQTILVIAGTTYVLDAKNFNESYGKAQYINDGLSKKNAKCRIRGAPNGAKYCLAYALDDFPIHEEMDTTYERDYWTRIQQWSKLSEDGKAVAGAEYGIKDPYDLI